MRADVARWIEKEGIAPDVTLAGFVTEEKLRALHDEADVYVSMSRSDSTSQSLLEAMAAGLFPIVSDIAGNREWVTHRREGYLVPAGDAEALACAIAESASDPEAQAIRSRGPAIVAARGNFEDTVVQLEGKLRTLSGSGDSA
jgi:glycosyltransferase involved in cell wall biosynthesis